MNNLMQDLETGSTANNAAIISIGAYFFGPEGLGDHFYVEINPQSCEDAGLHFSASTVSWWMQQTEAARKVWWSKDTASLQDALSRFEIWAKKNCSDKIMMWGNGSDFDNVILGNAYKAVGSRPFWSYGNHRCYRQLKSMVPKDMQNDLWTKHAAGEHHNALDDARRQALCAIDMMKFLGVWK